MEPIRIFVGTDVNGGCAECQMVYEYSLRKHSSVPIDLVWMKISEDPESFWYGWNTDGFNTPFSAFRYGIPEYCGYMGKAIYTDDDMLWLSDVAELWNKEIQPGKLMTGKKLKNGEIRHCVSLIDNEKFDALPKASRRKQNLNFNESMKALTYPSTQIIEDVWNCYDGENFDLSEVKLLHLTSMDTNPGIKMALERCGSNISHWYDGPVRQHRRQDVVDIFHQYYTEALENGYRVEDYIPSKRVNYNMVSQRNYSSNNGFDVTLGQ